MKLNLVLVLYYFIFICFTILIDSTMYRMPICIYNLVSLKIRCVVGLLLSKVSSGYLLRQSCAKEFFVETHFPHLISHYTSQFVTKISTLRRKIEFIYKMYLNMKKMKLHNHSVGLSPMYILSRWSLWPAGMCHTTPSTLSQLGNSLTEWTIFLFQLQHLLLLTWGKC